MDHREAQSIQAVERYLLNEFTIVERDEFEAHFFECDECAGNVRALTQFAEHVKAGFRQPAIDASQAPGWFGWLRLPWATPTFATIAFAGLSGFGWQTMRLGEPLIIAGSAVSDATRGTPRTVEARAGGPLMLTLDIEAPAGVREVEISIVNRSGKTLASQTGDVPAPGNSLSFVIRKPDFQPGEYVAVAKVPGGAEIGRYPFVYGTPGGGRS